MLAPNLKINKRFVITVLLCIGSGVSAYVLSSRLWLEGAEQEQRQAQEAIIDGLSISTSHLSVGDVWEEKIVTLELPIQNITSETIYVRDIKSSCGCMQISPRKLSIPATETAAVRVSINAQARRPDQVGEPDRAFFYDITPITRANDTNHGKSWRLEGVLRSRVTLSNLGIHFGESAVFRQAATPMKVEATVHVPAERIVATIVPEVVSIRIARKTDDPSRYDLFITPKESLPQGPFKADVTLEIERADGSRAFGATFPVEGVVQPEVRALPARLLLGSNKVGETVSAVVVLQVPSNTSVTVTQIETDSDNLHAAPTEVEGIPTGRAYRVKFKLTKEGDQSATLHFVLRKADRSLERLHVEVNAFGDSMK